MAGARLLVAAVAAYAAPAGLAYSPASWLVGVHQRLRSPESAALTFDDGPQPGATEHFLALLDQLEVRATFFLVGEQVRRHPALVREVQAAGHEIANHGFVHRNHLLRNPLDLLTDLRRGADSIGEATGHRPSLFRAPQGAVTAATRLAAYRERSAVVHWSTWGRDWRAQATPHSIAQEVLSGIRGGDIILLHDADLYSGRTWHGTFDAVPTIVRELRARGLRPGPIGGPSQLGSVGPLQRGVRPAGKTRR